MRIRTRMIMTAVIVVVLLITMALMINYQNSRYVELKGSALLAVQLKVDMLQLRRDMCHRAR